MEIINGVIFNRVRVLHSTQFSVIPSNHLMLIQFHFFHIQCYPTFILCSLSISIN
jgi:hypothetical protein